jgi:hypothetical protein
MPKLTKWEQATGERLSDWERDRTRYLLKEARDAVGRGFDTYCSPKQQEALVGREFLFMVLGQCDETVEKNPALATLMKIARACLAELNPEDYTGEQP